MNLERIINTDIEFIDGDRGQNYPSKSDFFANEYCVFLNTGNITKNGFDFSKLDFITEEKDKSLRKGKVKIDDIILTTRGTVGNVVLVTESIKYPNMRINSGMVIIRSKKDFTPLFLNTFFRSELFKKQALTNGSGSAQPQLPISALKNISIPKLDKKTQAKITSVLSALDEKIALNNQINATLEQMAKTLYDYWFLQFDLPDENGKPYKSSGGEMVYNDVLKRDIPKGWEVKSLWQIANYFNGLALQKYRPTDEEYLPVIKIREMNEGISSNTEKASPDIPKNAIIDDGNILFSWSASLDVMIWNQGKGALNQHIFKVTSEQYPKSFYYFELLNYLKHFKMMAELRKTTMGHITQDHLKQAYICIPKIELLEVMENKLKPIFDKNLILHKENRQLAKLRDWLLPMLMNGQVTVQ